MPSHHESGGKLEHPLHRGVLYFALAVMAIAPFIFESYPPWISGLTVAAYCAVGILTLLSALIFRVNFFPVPVYVTIPAYTLAAWLGLMVWRDYSDQTHTRAPALAIRTLPYVFAFLSAGMIGAQFSVNARIKQLYWVLTAVGSGLAFLAILQKSGFDVRVWKSATVLRPPGIFINANRFAVMESLCISSALALFLATFKEADVGYTDDVRRKIRQGILLVAIVGMTTSMVFTLSRLTIVAFGIGLGCVAFFWMRHRMKRDREEGSWGGSRAEVIQRWALMALPLLVMLAWAAGALSFGAHNLNERIQQLGKAENVDRIAAYKAALPMLQSTDAKIYGHGLGNFEAAFNAVQPSDLTGRWTRLHSDWMQLAIEAGLPALVLAFALFVAWFIAWWKVVARTRTERKDESLILRLVPLAGILTVLICTGGDFPLRATGLALAFFFLVGALIRNEAAVPSKAPWSNYVMAPVLLAAFGWSANVAGGNGAAYWNSPIRWQFEVPYDPGEKQEAWQRAVELDPGDPILHMSFANAAAKAKEPSPDNYAAALEHVRIAAALAPRDTSMPWLAAVLSDKSGDLGAVPDYFEQAISLYPQNLALRMAAGGFFLRRSRIMPPTTTLRDDAVTKALDYFTFVLEREPGYEAQIVGWMDEAGFSADETTRLWRGDSPTDVLARAREFWKHREWDSFERELKTLSPEKVKAGKKAEIWYHVLSGASDFRNEQTDSGIAHWGDAIKLDIVHVDDTAYRWVSQQTWILSVDQAAKTAEVMGEQLKVVPGVVNVLGIKLHEAGQNLATCVLLGKTAGNTDYLCVVFARAALAMNDLQTAENQAALAVRYQQPGHDWSAWRAKFDMELAERKRALKK